MGRIIGIDLGTTNSCFAYTAGDKQEIIPNADGDRTTPSTVYMKDDEQLIGKVAKRKAVLEPENVVYEAKRFIGRKYDEVKNEIDQVPYKIKKGKNNGVLINVNNKDYKPEQISAFILKKIKNDAEEYLGEEVTGAVITVPAYFNDSQRNATKAAGEIAGLEVERIINEPTAAALSYGMNKGIDENIAVFDLGGGTFDITILEVGAEGTFEVLSTNGNTQLGGADFDKRIVDYLVDEFQKQEGIDLSKKPMARQRLKDEAEEAKKQLSSQEKVEINIPFIINDEDGNPKHLNIDLTRAKFEDLIKDLVDKVRKPVKNAIKDSKISTDQIHQVLLVGGSTRVPLVKQTVKELFGNKPKSNVNPDEAVAKGAAVQAGILQGDVDDILLLDVTPLSLGVEVEGGMVDTVIPRNTTVPAKKTKTYTNAADNQSAVTIHVLQGERSMAKDNKSLGNFNLTGIPPMRRGQARIEVTFDMDKNGILHVSAKEQTTGKEQTVNIEGATDLSDEEIEKAKKEAEKYSEEDKRVKELMKAKNELESMAYSIDQFIEDSEDKLDDEDKDKLQKLSKEAKEMTDKDIEDATKKEFESKKQELENKLQEVYKKIGAVGGGAQGPQGPQGGAGSATQQQGQDNQNSEDDDEPEIIEGDVEDQ